MASHSSCVAGSNCKKLLLFVWKVASGLGRLQLFLFFRYFQLAGTVAAHTKGAFTYLIHGNGRVEIAYDFTTLDKINSRQVELELNLPGRFTKVSRDRQSLAISE